jgi:hypothetical protein
MLKDSTSSDRAAGTAEMPRSDVAIPPTLMALGAISLLRGAPLLGLGLLGPWLYRLASAADRDRHAHGRSLKARRAAAQRLDVALEDSFPASDPPSLSGITS